MRPKTAATTTKKDEMRIKQKLAALENIERKIEDDLIEFQERREKGAKGEEKQSRGEAITESLILE